MLLQGIVLSALALAVCAGLGWCALDARRLYRQTVSRAKAAQKARRRTQRTKGSGPRARAGERDPSDKIKRRESI